MTDFAASLAAARSVRGPVGDQKSSVVPELSGFAPGLPGWSHFLPAERELNERWVGHQRIETVDEMLNHWQVAAVRQVIRLPAHRYIIELDPQDTDPVAADFLAADLDVPLVNAPDERRTGRRAKRFSSRRHLDRALDALDYGHAVFEHAGQYVPGVMNPGQRDWRLVDLPPVPQWTISDQNSWEIDRQGRVLNVIQWGSNPPTKLSVDHLAVFTWQGKPGDPRGRSMLRPLTGAWTMSDRLVRVMGMSGERTGMGIPVGKVETGAVAGAKEKMERLLAGLAAGHDTNLTLETDGDIRQHVMLMGVTGQTPDIVAMLRFLDDVMARAMLAMLLNLNQAGSGGSNALGLTFDELLRMFYDTVIGWYCDTMTEQVCEPWIDRNLGEDAPAPRLVWRRREDDVPPVAAVPVVATTTVDSTATEIPAVGQLPVAACRRGPVSSSRVASDPEVSEGIALEPKPRSANRTDGSQSGTSAPSLTSLTSLARRQQAVRSSFATVAGRDLRRDPTPIELAAGTDFATIEQQFVATRGQIATALLAVRDELTGVAVEQVAAMPQVDPLTLGDTLAPLLEQHAAEQMDAGPLAALLVAFAVAGVHQVIGEAVRQGVGLAASVDYTDRAATDAADLMRRMARQVADSTATAARSGMAPGMGGQPAANVVADHLGSLSSAMAEQAAGGAASRAQNAGRAAAIEVGEANGVVTSVLATEIMDPNCCGPCLLVDGRQYPSLASALADYPSTGYARCEGLERCRGLLSVIFDASGSTTSP